MKVLRRLADRKIGRTRAAILPTMTKSLLMMVAALAAAVSHADTAKKVVLGKLGQAIQETPITSKPGGRVYYRVKPYEYLVLRTSDQPNTYKVLLQNGREGYVKSDAVAKLPYDVTAPQQPRVAALASRGGGASKVPPTTRAAVANYSLNFTGTPYVWGGNDPNRGIDCSGFVKYLYGQIGVSLPRTAAEQALVGQPITRLEDLQAGDRLYFWSNSRGKIGHTGIYLGGGYFCHATSSKGEVTTDYLGTQKWLKQLVAARR